MGVRPEPFPSTTTVDADRPGGAPLALRLEGSMRETGTRRRTRQTQAPRSPYVQPATPPSIFAPVEAQRPTGMRPAPRLHGPIRETATRHLPRPRRSRRSPDVQLATSPSAKACEPGGASLPPRRSDPAPELRPGQAPRQLDVCPAPSPPVSASGGTGRPAAAPRAPRRSPASPRTGQRSELLPKLHAHRTPRPDDPHETHS